MLVMVNRLRRLYQAGFYTLSLAIIATNGLLYEAVFAYFDVDNTTAKIGAYIVFREEFYEINGAGVFHRRPPSVSWRKQSVV